VATLECKHSVPLKGRFGFVRTIGGTSNFIFQATPDCRKAW
jgi:hypothetical protein